VGFPGKVERTGPAVLTIRLSPDKSGWEQSFLLTSDQHVDSIHSDHDLFRKHLNEAKERNAGIMGFGDLCDCMGGKFDKRADPRSIRPELREGNYWDMVPKYNAEFLEPFAPWIVHLNDGNHETAAAKYAETNLTERIAERLKAKGAPVQVGGYQGWVRFLFQCKDGFRQSLKLRYSHGYGGSSPVTRGVIHTARELVYLPDADLLVGGHLHENYQVTVRRERLKDSGRIEMVDCECLRIPGYKDEYSAQAGWACEKGMPPKPKGGWWVTFRYNATSGGRKAITFDVQRAK
jgi:hypothetical protein